MHILTTTKQMEILLLGPKLTYIPQTAYIIHECAYMYETLYIYCSEWTNSFYNDVIVLKNLSKVKVTPLLKIRFCLSVLSCGNLSEQPNNHPKHHSNHLVLTIISLSDTAVTMAAFMVSQSEVCEHSASPVLSQVWISFHYTSLFEIHTHLYQCT